MGEDAAIVPVPPFSPHPAKARAMSTGKYYIGVDPGKSGAMTAVDSEGGLVSLVRLKETPRDVWLWLHAHRDKAAFAVLEKVAAMPKQGVSSTFKFGRSFGMCEAFLVAAGIRYELATPQKWQKYMGCMSRGDKNVTKSRAQALFPDEKVIHATADSMLLADYARRIRSDP